jgi:hypothetical protein
MPKGEWAHNLTMWECVSYLIARRSFIYLS